jgi:hypothetical protein
MEKIKAWLRKKILAFLGLDKTVNQLQIDDRRIAQHVKKFDQYLDESDQKLKKVDQRITKVDQKYRAELQQVRSNFKLGVDARYQGTSWAILCGEFLEGDLVKIVTFSDKEFQEVVNFMREFKDYPDKHYDAPDGLLRHVLGD